MAPPDRSDEPGSTGTTPRSRSGRMLWAQFLARIYGLLALLYPACGGEMWIISFTTYPAYSTSSFTPTCRIRLPVCPPLGALPRTSSISISLRATTGIGERTVEKTPSDPRS